MNTYNRDFRSDQVLDPNWLPSYKEQIGQLHLQASELSNNLFLLERIATFPFHLFGLEHRTFWWLVAKSLFESSLLCAWRIAIDGGGDFLTIRRFKNEVMKHIIDANAKKEIQKRLKTLEFESKLKNVQDRIRDYRHQRLAHFRPAQSIVLLHGVDLAEVRDAVIELIDFFGFEVGYAYLLSEYNPGVIHPAGTDSRPDIERLLDECARQSRLISMPEEHPNMWEHYREHMKPKDIELFNGYRAKFGLPRIGNS